ncbi:MAG TPA: hypothetical protein DCG57_01230 [Candidatus Riflebacteria bacterium]|nr:hypothetical protein [Candidatus Riflebacteria bacterium]
MSRKFACPKSAFTLIEAIIAALVSCTVMLAVHLMFSHTVRVAIKGQDNLDSIRAASQIFSSLRNDLRDFVSLSPAGAKITLGFGESEVPENAEYSKVLKIKKQVDRITYRLIESGGKQYVERNVDGSAGSPEQRRLFGVPRMKDFGVLYVKSQNRFDALPKNVGQLLVRVTVDSEDQRFASKEVRITSVFFSDRLADDDWNHLDF